MTPAAEELVTLLEHRANAQAAEPAFRFLVNGEVDGPIKELTFAELAQRARTIAAALQRQHVGREPVLLVYPPGLDFIAALFGCLYAGAIAVPVTPPRPARPGRSLARLHKVAEDCGARWLLTTQEGAELEPACRQLAPELSAVRWMVTEGLVDERGWEPPRLTPETIAFLQYTSGSTAEPKGVMISHGNLVHNSAALARFGLRPGRVLVSWLPSYHDMGLIGGILQPVYTGCLGVLMSPTAFIQSPRRWLEAISRYQAYCSPFPNFALEWCVQRIPPEKRRGLELGSWRVATNGAEPVRTESLERFATAFAEAGFRADALFPVYGLAEATLIVSGGQDRAAGARPSVLQVEKKALLARRMTPGEDPATTRTLVGCGRPIEGQELLIVDPEQRVRCGPNEIGEIWVRGPSVALGYWGHPDDTERVFGARLRCGEGPYLRTGDLGFLDGGEVYVTGRVKDVVIIRGQNHAPQDLELTIEKSHPVIAPGFSAAFSIEVDDEECLAVVVGIDERARRASGIDPSAIVAAVHTRIALEHDLRTHAVVLVRHTEVPKTTSGKIRRSACQHAFLAGALNPIEPAPISWTHPISRLHGR
jgi:acyl-CoA synthetase (AMP-forming)/AMP-acid ligase II